MPVNDPAAASVLNPAQPTTPGTDPGAFGEGALGGLGGSDLGGGGLGSGGGLGGDGSLSGLGGFGGGDMGGRWRHGRFRRFWWYVRRSRRRYGRL